MSHPQTISEYWQSHGHSKQEADRMERQQILEAMEEADRDSFQGAGDWWGAQ